MTNVSMQTTLNAYTVAGAAEANLDAPVPFLTPEALMTYCASRLQGIDAQVNTAFAKQTDANNAVNSLNSVSTWISNNVAGAGWDMSLPANQGGAYGQVTLGAIQNQIDQLPPNSQGAVMLTKLRDDIASRMDTSGKLKAALDDGSYWKDEPSTPNQSDDERIKSLGGNPAASKIDPTADIKPWTDEIDADTKTINSGSELMMIQLQQLVSERQTAVQLTTGMIQSFDDGTKSIVSNIHG